MNVINNLKVGTKIYTSVFILIALLVTLSVVVSSKLATIGEELKSITEQDIPLTEVVSSITIHQMEQGIALERMLRHGSAMHRDKHQEELFYKALERFETLANKSDTEIKQG